MGILYNESSNAHVKLTLYGTFYWSDSKISQLEIFRITGFQVKWFPNKSLCTVNNK